MTIKEIIKHVGRKAEEYPIMIAPEGDLTDLRETKLYLDIVNKRIVLSDAE